jgi:hypothetical protein
MPNRTHKRKRRRINCVMEARAGLIPASDHVADERRVITTRIARIIRTVKPCLGPAPRVSDDLAITGILADLRHYCDYKGLAFERLDSAAHTLYLEDADGAA